MRVDRPASAGSYGANDAHLARLPRTAHDGAGVKVAAIAPLVRKLALIVESDSFPRPVIPTPVPKLAQVQAERSCAAGCAERSAGHPRPWRASRFPMLITCSPRCLTACVFQE